MNSKRSYLDTLNDGRQRRPHTTLEQLNRSLETLEQRLERSREETADYQRADARYAGADPRMPNPEPRYPSMQPFAQRPFEDPRAGQRPYEEPRPAPRAPQQANSFIPQRPSVSAPPAFDQNYQSLARDIDRVRGQEDSVAVVGKIAGELRGLREELRHQMTTGLQREFGSLRKEIEHAYQSNDAGKHSAELGLEFERLSGAIQTLADKSDDRSVNMLRLELEQVKSALDTLAREESVQKVDQRWDDFYRRFNAFEDRVDANANRKPEVPGLSALTERLEQISSAVNNLPESMSLRSLEEKVRTLAGAVEHFAGQQENRGSDTFALIDERLDEISRAIVASTVAAQANSFDPEPLDRIEQRIASLASQIEEVANDRPTVEIIDRLNMLSHRVDDLAARAHLPEQAMERLAGQIALIADKIDRAPALPDADYIFQGLEHRFDILSGMMERRQGDSQEQSNMLFRDLERRLDEVADRLDHRMPDIDSAGIMEAIDARFTALAHRLETRTPDPAGEAAIRGLESRLENISRRLETPVSDPAGQAAIRGLENRLEGISKRLDTPAADPASQAAIRGLENRLENISKRLDTPAADPAGQAAIRGLESRLENISKRLDTPAADLAGQAAIRGLETRLENISKRLDTPAADPAGQAAIRGLENRLQDISKRLDTSAAQVAGIDPDLIRSLESQVAGLSAHLSKPGTPLPEFEDISPRLGQLEKTLAGTRDSILEAARDAAESAVRSMAGSNANTAAVTGLAQDLKTLENLTRRSDERNSKTFEAIHDTLLKIVDRLGSLETGEPEEPASRATAQSSAPSPKIAVQDAPSLDIDQPLPLTGNIADLDGRAAAIMRNEPGSRTPAEAAAAAALAALGSDTAAEKDGQGARKKSMLGGLARAFGGGKKEAEAPMLAGSAPSVDAPTVDLDEPLDPKVANRPLEPGSGAPDLNAIMKRVRDERGQPVKHSETDAAKSDFIAAARRAAQAAAAEAEVLKRQSTITGPVRALRIGDLLKARRKPILMAAAAIMMALAGLQLGKAFLSDPVQVASTDAAPAPIAPQMAQAASADAAGAAAKATQEMAVAADTTPVRVVGQAEPEAARAKDDGAIADTATSEAMAAAPAEASDSDGAEASAPTTPEVDTAAAAPAAPSPVASEPATTADPTPATTGAVAPADAAVTDTTAKIDVPADAGPVALRDAAAGGDSKALFEIGSRYAEGRGVKEDMAAAAKWYEKSAEIGFAPAEYRIGNFYEKGIGVARDIPKSKTWYQLAADQGNASAMHNLAVLFAMAADGVTDNESAARWFQAAADLGVKDSQFNLGILAAKGVGMPQNLEESYKWFALVAKTGDKDAAAKRDEIANALRPEQLDRAKAATELWKAKPLDPAANSVDVPESWQDGTPQTTAGIDMKKAVQNIQLILNKNGYDAGGSDGVMGQKTKSAIMAFQTDNGMKATGEVDEKLVKALLAHK